MKKICYITTISLSIKSFFIPQLQYLAENGFDVYVVCSYDKTLAQKLGDKIHYVPIHIARGVSPETIIKSINDLKKFFKKEKFDIVQYSTPNAALCASIAAKSVGVKVRNYHLMGLRYLSMNGLSRVIFKSIEKLSCSLSTNIECISPSNLELSVKENLFSEEKAVMVWNGSTGGVDMAKFNFGKRDEWHHEIRRELGYDEDEFVFGFVGRITADKGINELFKAFENIGKPCRLLVIGTVEAAKTIDKKLFDMIKKDKRVTFVEWTDKIEKYYAAMDMIILPSYREGFGMVTIEAQAVGTPAIVTNIPGPRDLVEENVTGFIVEPKNEIMLEDKMNRCLDDTQKCRAMSQVCVDFVKKHYDSVILCKKILERKNELLGM